MSTISSWLWGTSQLDDAVDRATSELLPAGSEDIALNLEICDQIRSKSTQPKDAMRALKRRLNHKNPNVQLLALSLTDVCLKNGGDHFLSEIASREFMDNLVSILHSHSLNRDVREKTLRYIQSWALAFEGKPSLSYAGQVYKTLQGEGFKFPPESLASASSAMVDTQTAPEWIDSDVCLRCRTSFSFTNRKHHCRNCGQVFDQQCSSKSLPLPHFGITQEVRVCDGCYTKLTRHKDQGLSSDSKRHRSSHSVGSVRHRSTRDLADAELQRAIQLSLEEVNGHGQHGRPGYVPYPPEASSWQVSEPPLVDRNTRPLGQDDEEDPDLKAAIEASLREASAPKPSAPVVVEFSRGDTASFAYSGAGYSQSYPPTTASVPALPNYDIEPLEADAILTFSQTVEQVQQQGGRDMSRYPAVTQLFDKANSLRPKLAMSLDDAGRKEEMLAEMNDKLSQAVKLYDKILTEQLSRPYRAAPVAPPPHQSPFAPIEPSYSQWSPASQQTPLSPRTNYAPQMQQAASVHHPSVLQVYSPSAGTPSAEQSFAHHQQKSPQAWSQYTDPRGISQPPVFQLPTSPASAHPQSIALHNAYDADVQQSYQTRATHPSQREPSQLPQISPPVRHSTTQVYAAPSHPPAQSTLSRANTVSQPTQQQYAPVKPTPLPHFPAVPTAPPEEVYSPYSSSVSSGVEQTERKEALLIEF